MDSEATTQAPPTVPTRPGHGGRRPGAGRPRKPAPAPHAPDVGDVVLFGDPDSRRPDVVAVRPAVVLWADRPGDPDSPLDLSVLSVAGSRGVRDVPYGAGPAPGCWAWPARRGG
jgi:hypothetical protein